MSIHILLIAPSAPPKNSPEAIQVGRLLKLLNPSIRVTLVTPPPVNSGWAREDSTLTVDRPRLQVITPTLPVHRLMHRILTNSRLAWYHVPDTEFWLLWFTQYIIQQLRESPDVIYSRSGPYSAALLAQQLKLVLKRPWLMHLSDPWADSPYRRLKGKQRTLDQAYESRCFTDADLITLTTEGQANFYRQKYPNRADSISVTPNMMPVDWRSYRLLKPSPDQAFQKKVRIIHVGSLYGDRNPDGLLTAIENLFTMIPDIDKKLSIEFVGNMSKELSLKISSYPACIYHGSVSFKEAMQYQINADILLCIESKESTPLHQCFLPSKIVDYLALQKPILALTPKKSVTSHYCHRGYGWAFEPDDVSGITKFLLSLLQNPNKFQISLPPPPIELDPIRVTTSIENKLLALSKV
ncbi:glycosyltransferase [Thermosynechococcus sichuanensis E542]|uniref:glycosyltransferase n=1 Tax=Thermosynechococcus sichuanensis TaxID=3161974 RepID=UPI0015E5903F|nr:glycosyltransferase [Thermosynechococcus vestitus]AXY68622.2 glycosyltransferase [Thermosynechococcus vestitus E542]